MRVLRIDRLESFISRHSDVEHPLTTWLTVTKAAKWRNLMDVRKTFRHADGVKLTTGRVITVFNLKGNHYRLLTAIDYPMQVVNVLECLTHAEYSKDRWKTSL